MGLLSPDARSRLHSRQDGRRATVRRRHRRVVSRPRRETSSPCGTGRSSQHGNPTSNSSTPSPSGLDRPEPDDARKLAECLATLVPFLCPIPSDLNKGKPGIRTGRRLARKAHLGGATMTDEHLGSGSEDSRRRVANPDHVDSRAARIREQPDEFLHAKPCLPMIARRTPVQFLVTRRLARKALPISSADRTPSESHTAVTRLPPTPRSALRERAAHLPQVQRRTRQWPP